MGIVAVDRPVVGTAKMRPDSLSPRRLSSVTNPMRTRQIGTGLSCHDANAGIDVIARVPAQIDTATVST